MKNKIYLLGIITSSLLIVGSLFKIMHWPGAGIILTVSILSLILAFFPTAFVSCYRENGKKKTALYISAFITLFFLFLSSIFKIMHWEGASILLFIGILFPIIVFLPVYLYFHFKEEEESLTNFLYIIFFLVGLSAMSGFLAVDISKDMLTDMTRITDVTDLSEYYKLKVEQKKEYRNVKPAEEILNQSKSLLDKINGIKIDLALCTESNNSRAITENNVLQIWKLPNIYGKDAGGEILANQGKGYYLLDEINRFYSFLISIPEIKADKSLAYITNLPGLVSIDYNDDNKDTWVIFNSNMPLILVLLRLTEVENCIRLAELEAMSLVCNDEVSVSNSKI